MAITVDDIPDWYVADTVDLAAYLTANSHRNTIRIFAREVTIAEDISWNADMTRIELDLRIDCHTLRVSGQRKIDLSGSHTALGWKAPTTAKGDPGFLAGGLQLNAINLRVDGPTDTLAILADGGNGGAGGKGLPGQPGMDQPPTVPSWLPGQPGQPGGPAGDGGDGANGGWVVVSICNTDDPRGIGPIISVSAKGGLAGPGGDGGDGGEGGTAANGGEPKGANGAAGAAGKPGQPGSENLSSNCSVTELSELIVGWKSSDSLPGGLELRFHRLINALIFAFYPSLNPNLSDQLGWMKDLATAFGFSLVEQRIDMVLAALPVALLTEPRRNGLLPAGAKEAMLSHLSQFGGNDYVGSNPQRGQLSIAASASYAADEQAHRALIGEAPFADPGGAFQQSFAASLPSAAHIAMEVSPVSIYELFDFFDSGNTTGDCSEAALEALETEETAELAAADLALSEVAIELLAVDAVVDIVTLGISSIVRACRNHRRKEQLRRRQEQAAWNARILQWELDETKKKAAFDELLTDIATQHATEARASQAAIDKINGRDGRDRARAQHGLRMIGVLQSVLPIEDGMVSGEQPANYIARFDCLLLPPVELLDMSVAAYIASAYASFSFVIDWRVNQTFAGQANEGIWYIIDLKGANDADFDGELVNTIGFVTMPMLGSGVVLQFLYEAPTAELAEYFDAGYSRASFTSAVEFGKLLDIALQIQQLPVPPSTPKPAPMVRSSVTVDHAIVHNVRQGSCHSFYSILADGTAQDQFYYDMGYGGASDVTMLALASRIATSGKPVLLSHWDFDHFRLATQFPALITAHNPIVAPAYGLNGPSLVRFCQALVSGGYNAYRTALLLAGPQWPAALAGASFVGAAPALATLLDQSALTLLPHNASAETSSRRPLVDNSVDRNNSWAIGLRIDHASGTAAMFPGDCCYDLFSGPLIGGLTHLEATHHGSLRSIAAAGPSSNPAAARIPVARPSLSNGGHLYFSNGLTNSYGHSAAKAAPYYAAKGWTQILATSTAGSDLQIDMTAPP